MITYHYKCSACKHEEDIQQRITADKLTTCTKCGEEEFHRIPQANPFILKGDGWAGNYSKGKWHDPTKR